VKEKCGLRKNGFFLFKKKKMKKTSGKEKALSSPEREGKVNNTKIGSPLM